MAGAPENLALVVLREMCAEQTTMRVDLKVQSTVPKSSLGLFTEMPYSETFIMTERFQRYAIYWTPAPETAMAEFGALWLGGTETFGLAPAFTARAIKSPAHYGLHATLKAPFRLRDDVSPRALQDALDEFCSTRRPASGGPLALAQYQRYLTLALNGNTADIDWLAAESVTHFDRFRAPLEEIDRNRREIDSMSPREATFLEEFGYPYVLSDFRFHISLAGPLAASELDETAKALDPHLASFVTGPFQIEDLTLLGEPKGGGVFKILSRHRFGR